MNNKETTTIIPPREGIEYLPHQVLGVRWMLDREAVTAPICRGGILADDMGLGKTFQTIGLLKNSPLKGLRTLIVCPPALVAGWTEELRACGFVVATFMGSAVWSVAPADVTGTAVDSTVWLTTYPKVCMYYRAESAPFSAPYFDRVILDEGHVIRNGRDTVRGKSCSAIADMPNAKHGGVTLRWILSATPVQNGPHDWKNLCQWLRPRGIKEVDIPRLGDVIMLRRTMAELRDDVAALPAAPAWVAHHLTVPSSEGAAGAEGRLFNALCNQLQSALENKHVKSFIKLELYLRIQQFLVHPQLYIDAMRAKFGSGYSRPDWKGSATKWEAFHAEMLRAVADRAPVIVFCNFRAEMDRVCAAAAAAGAGVWCVRGGMGAGAVGAAVADARAAAEAGEAVVFVVQIVAGGAGLNLQFCTRVLFLSQHWNPAVVHQAVGRAVRIGQRAVVEVHVFRIVDDVLDNLDRRMVELHLGKIAVARAVCETLYEGFEPLRETAADLVAVAEPEAVEEEGEDEDEPADVDSDSEEEGEGDPQVVVAV